MAEQSTKQNENSEFEIPYDTKVPYNERVPLPPPFQRRIVIARVQWVGIPLLAILPLLALLNAFDGKVNTADASRRQIAIQVDYATNYRYDMQDSMTVSVTHWSPHSPATITIAFDRDYLEHFSDVSFMPDVERITDKSYEVELSDMLSGETRRVVVEMNGDGYGILNGSISASLSAVEAVTVSVNTITFP